MAAIRPWFVAGLISAIGAGAAAAPSPTEAPSPCRHIPAKPSRAIATRTTANVPSAPAPVATAKPARAPIRMAAAVGMSPTVSVFLERNGRIVDRDGQEVEIPAFGGGDRVWASVVGCVKQHFAPFNVEIVDTEPTGAHITAVVGGLASQLGLSDRTTAGVGPYIPNQLQLDATVHVFSQVTGEQNVSALCATTAHEIGHALGLDHVYKCGDVMSYFGDRCGAPKFVDADSPCGESRGRSCGTGARTQNSYRMLASLVGLREAPRPRTPEPAPTRDTPGAHDPWADRAADTGTTDASDDANDDVNDSTNDDPNDASDARAADPVYWRDRAGTLYRVEYVRGRDGRAWVILRRQR